MPSSLEAIIQNMIQAGIPQAQMMQLLQTMQASANNNNNNISSPTINGSTNSATNSSSGANQTTTNHQQTTQHFSLTNNPNHQNANQSTIVASNGSGGAGMTTGANVAGAQQAVAVAAAASLQHLANFQHQQHQIIAAHHHQQQQLQHQQSASVNNSTASSVHQAHAGTVAASGAVGQPQSAIHATALMQQMAAVAAAVHPQSHQSSNTTSALQAAMQQHLQQSAVAAASAAGSATHPMAAALAQASGKNNQFIASLQQQQQASVGNTGVSVSLPPGMAVAVQHPQLASNVGQTANSNNNGQLVPPPLATPSLAWPIFQPIVHVPYFDMATYQKVNLDVQPSAMANGMDLPLNDINTLRFFFNFGVQHARVMLLRQHIHSQQPQQQQQIALLQNAGGTANTQTGQERMNNANEQLQLQQKLLMQQSLIKAQNDAAAAASINEKSANGSNAANSGNVSNNAAAQLLHGGIVGFQNQLQMNQLAALMANQQNAKLVNLSGAGVDSSVELNSGGAAGQQLRSSSQQNTSQQQNQLTAMQQLLLQQQQQQQLTAALAAQQQQQQQQEQTIEGGVIGHQRQTPLNDLVRSHFLGSNGNNNGNSVNRTPNSTPSNHSNIQGNGHGGGSTNGTPRPINGRNSVNGLQQQQQQTTLSSCNSSVSPKTGSVGVPTDPAPRKQSSMIIPNPLNTELVELKQRGLNALRSPEAMSEGLQKRLIEMAATLNSAVIAPMTTGGGGGNGGNIISTGGACNGSSNSVPPAVLLQQQQQTYQQQHQMLQQQLLQQHLINLQQQQNGGLTSQNQQNSLTNNFSNSISNLRSQSNNGQQQQSGNLLQSIEIDGTPSLLAATEMHYNETFRQEGVNKKTKPDTPGRQPPDLEVGAGLSQRRKSGVYMLGMNIKEEIGIKSTTPQSTTPLNQSTATLTSTPAISTSAMMNYMNNMLTTARSHLQGQGVGIYYDQNGNQIDYSSRPIDPIFRRAREELNHSPGSNLLSSNVNNTASVANNNNNTAITQASTVTSIGENNLTTSAVGGDLGVLSRTCLIGISDTNRRGSIGGPQQLAGAQAMTVQQPIPLSTALYSGNLTPQQLQQHYFQLQQQQQHLQQLQQIQQLHTQIQQQQQLQSGIDSLDSNKKRPLNTSGGIITSDEGPSSAKSARSSVGNSSDLIIDTNSIQCSNSGQNEEMPILTGILPTNNDTPINIIDVNNSDISSKQKLNELSEDDDFNENNSINVVQEENEEEEERNKDLDNINEGNNNLIKLNNEEINSPSNGKQLRIVEDEDDDQ